MNHHRLLASIILVVSAASLAANRLIVAADFAVHQQPDRILITAPSQLLSVLRRREGDRCWIDAYGSDDNGTSWKLRSKVADIAGPNGNPPSLACLPNGRLGAAYGTRVEPYGIRAKVSDDKGQTWSDEIVLRPDGRNWDLGYPRTVVRPDGKLVTIYYFTTGEKPEQHIAATIWQPPAAR